MPKNDLPIEQYFRVNEIAAKMKLHPGTVRRHLENRPGVKILGDRVTTKRKQRHRVLMIPASVLEEWLRELE